MRIAESHFGTGRKPIPGLFGWIFAAFVMVVAIFGPPLTGQSIPAPVELRHDILMIDREFERSSLRTNTSSFQIGAFAFDDVRRGSASTGSRMPVRGGTS